MYVSIKPHSSIFSQQINSKFALQPETMSNMKSVKLHYCNCIYYKIPQQQKNYEMTFSFIHY
jgi:hypothetical protein